jgi:hypothetical protein
MEERAMKNEIVARARSWHQRARQVDRSTAIVYPYRDGTRWAFDGGSGEPRLLGLDHLVDEMTIRIPRADAGFALYVSTRSEGGHAAALRWIGNDESGGWNLYELEDGSARGWLPPEIVKWFNCAPNTLFLRAEPLRAAQK